MNTKVRSRCVGESCCDGHGIGGHPLDAARARVADDLAAPKFVEAVITRLEEGANDLPPSISARLEQARVRAMRKASESRHRANQ